MTVPREVTAGLCSLAAVFLIAGACFRPAAAEKRAPLRGVSRRTAPLLPGGGLPGAGPTIRLLGEDGTVATLALEDYVQGVVTAEMPASFEPAALEAQGVCARTYALSRAQSAAHGSQADVCADPGCCQAYTAEAPADWGHKAALYREKIAAAVAATEGQVLRADGGLISAVFHASSQGKTAPAQAVWGAAVPYLVSVDTPETAETVSSLESEVTLPAEEFKVAALAHYPEADLSGPAEGWVTDLVRADWGGVERLSLGGVTLTGSQVRGLFGLRSARFTVESNGEAVTFHVTGYGHGVGMSQQGANLLAKEGRTCAEILAHYYPGTELERA